MKRTFLTISRVGRSRCGGREEVYLLERDIMHSVEVNRLFGGTFYFHLQS